MLEFILGAIVGAAAATDSKGTISDYEQIQIDKVIEIADTINLLGRTLPPGTDITKTVRELKTQFDGVDRSGIESHAGIVVYNAVRDFFKRTLG